VADIVMLRGQRQALLVGKMPGTTTLLLWHRKQAEPQRLQVRVQSAVQGAASTGGNDLVFTQQDQQGLLQGSTDSVLSHMQEQTHRGDGAGQGRAACRRPPSAAAAWSRSRSRWSSSTRPR
jgi:hypothetical protein